MNEMLKGHRNSDQAKLARRRRRLLGEMGLSPDLDPNQIVDAMYVLWKKDKEKDSIIAFQGRKISKLEKKAQNIQGKYDKLKEKHDAPAKNSGNSSIPPSKNPIGIPHTQSQREKSDRKPGGQEGHPGSTLEPREDIDSTVKCEPGDTTCPECGAELPSEGVIAERRQVIDIPTLILPTVQNFERMVKVCPCCGHTVSGSFPEGVKGQVSYGNNIKVLVTYLSVVMNSPVNKIRSYMSLVYSIKMSTGTIANILDDLGEMGKATHKSIRDMIAACKWTGADESGTNVGGENKWMWAFQNAMLTYLVVEEHRSHDMILKHFSKEELAEMILVTDRLGAYFMDEIGAKDHQICLAHLIRNLTFTMLAYPNDKWSEKMLELIRGAIHLRNEGNYGQELRDEMQRRLEELLAEKPVYVLKSGKKTELDILKDGIAKRKDYVFNFLICPELPATNNDTEKAIRPLKGKLKQAGCFRSMKGARNYATVNSIVQTAQKNGVNPMDALRDVVAGKEARFMPMIRDKLESQRE